MRILPSLGLALATLGAAALPGWAHGGSHPTPWPSPSPSPNPSPSPDTPVSPTTATWAPVRPTPSPTPSTPTTPTTPTTPARPVRPTDGGPTGPTGPAAPTTPRRAAGDDRTSWQVWWYLNKWHYLQVERRAAQVSGDAAGGAGAHDALWEFLLERTRDDYFDVRSAACLALGRAGHAGLAGWMQKSVYDGNPEVRESALLGLGSLGSPMPVFHLAGMLKNTREGNRLRAAAAVALGLTGDPSAVPVLRDRLGHEPETTVRGAAALALGFCGGAAAIEPLTAVARSSSEDREVRAYAVAALGRLLSDRPAGDEPDAAVTALRRLLRSEHADHVRRAAAGALAAAGDPAALPDLRAAWQGDSDKMVQRFAMLAAAELARGRDTAPAILKDLLRVAAGGSGPERGFACLAIGILGEARGGVALRSLVAGGGQNDTRAAAALGCGLLHDRAAHAAVLQVATGHGDARLRGYSALALGMIGHPDAPAALRGLLDDEREPTMRASAALALGLTGAARDVTALARLLDSQSAYLRMSTAAAIGLLRDDAAIAPVQRRFAAEPSQEVRAMLVVALGRIAQREPVAPFHRLARWLDYTVRNDAIDLAMRLQ